MQSNCDPFEKSFQVYEYQYIIYLSIESGKLHPPLTSALAHILNQLFPKTDETNVINAQFSCFKMNMFQTLTPAIAAVAAGKVIAYNLF